MTNFYTNAYYDYESILVSERQSDGTRKYKREPFVPSLFIPSNTETEHKSIHGEYLSEMTFDSYSSYKEFNEKSTEFIEIATSLLRKYS